VWLAACWPLVLAVMLFVVYTAYTGSIVGRHMYPAIGALIVMIVAGLQIALGPRWGTLAICLLVVVALHLERTENRFFIDTTYLRQVVVPGIAPVVNQSLNTGWVQASELQVESSCPVIFFGLAFQRGEPSEMTFVDEDGLRVARIVLGPTAGVTTYLVETPYPSNFRLTLPPGATIGATDEASSGAVRIVDRPESPVAQLQCQTSEWRQVRFDQLYPKHHPDWVTYRAAAAWGDVWAWGTTAIFAAVLAVLAWRCAYPGVRRRLATRRESSD
jgi:hypothetical protein